MIIEKGQKLVALKPLTGPEADVMFNPLDPFNWLSLLEKNPPMFFDKGHLLTCVGSGRNDGTHEGHFFVRYPTPEWPGADESSYHIWLQDKLLKKLSRKGYIAWVNMSSVVDIYANGWTAPCGKNRGLAAQ